MINYDPGTTYKRFSESLYEVVKNWNPESHQYMRKLGTVDRNHEMTGIALRAAVESDDSLPQEWTDIRVIREGVSIFGGFSFMKAAIAGYHGMPREGLESYVLSNDGFGYAARLAHNAGLVSALIETDLALLEHPGSYPDHVPVINETITLVDGKLSIPDFDGLRNDSIEVARKHMAKKNKELKAEGRCPALMHKAFPLIYKAVNILTVNSGNAEAAYNRFAAMRTNEVS